MIGGGFKASLPISDAANARAEKKLSNLGLIFSMAPSILSKTVDEATRSKPAQARYGLTTL